MKNKVFRQRLAYVLALTMGAGIVPLSANVTMYEEKNTIVATDQVTTTPSAVEIDKVQEEKNASVEKVTKEEKENTVAIDTAKTTSSALTVSETVSKHQKGKTAQVIVEGYIVGWSDSKGNPSFSTEGALDSNIVIADSLSDTDANKIIPVKLKAGSDARKLWNLKDNTQKLTQKVIITATLKDGFGRSCLDEVKNIELSQGEVTPQKLVVKANPAGGNVIVGDSIELSCTTESAIIYYNINNEGPIQYSKPIEVKEKGKLKIVAYAENQVNGEKSQETIFDYTARNLEDITIKDVRSEKAGEVVGFKGTVTRRVETGIYVQDGTAAIYVFGNQIPSDIAVGDEVKVQGKLENWSELLEVKDTRVTKLGVGQIIAPKPITINEFITHGEDYESMLIEFDNVKMGDLNTSGETKIEDATGSTIIFKAPEGTPVGFDTYHIVALGAQHSDKPNEGYQLTLAQGDDVTPLSGMQKLPNMIIKQDEVLNLPKTVQVAENGKLVNKSVTWNASDVAKVNTSKIDNYSVRGTVEDGRTVTIKIQVITKGELRICDIQGKGHTSPFVSAEVKNIKGVVTAIDKTFGFYIQSVTPDDDDDTSEGIYIKYDSKKITYKPVKGDLVAVDGVVEEGIGHTTNPNSNNDVQLTVTQVRASKVESKNEKVELPKAIVVGEGGRIAPNKIIDNDNFNEFDPEEDAIDFYESLEGMLIQVNDAQVVGGTKYKEIPVMPDRGKNSANGMTYQGGVVITKDNMHPEKIILGMGIGEKQSDLPNVKVGDVFVGSMQGIMGYNDGNYKMLVNKDELPILNPAVYENPNPVTRFEETENGLRIAAFNVENLGGNEKQEKYDKLAQVIAHNLKLPDIIGLEEVQDNSGKDNNGIVEADVVYTRLIDAIKKQKGAENINYNYVEIAPEDNVDGGQPGGNIRVGMLYRTDRVQLVAESKKGDAKTATKAIKDKDGTASLTLNPGRITPESEAFISTRKSLAAQFVFKGQKVMIISNHLSSKGGDDPTFGNRQPAGLHTEARRLEQAKIVNQFVKEVLAVDHKAKIVALGDLNDFEFSNPVNVFEGKELYNMIEKLPESKRYSYNFQGNSQVLDNILVTSGLEKNTEIEILNMNSCMPKEEQLSDHDPSIICIDMSKSFNRPGSGSSSSQSSPDADIINTNNTGIVIKQDGANTHIGLSEQFITQGMKDSKENTIIFEAKNADKMLDNVSIDLNAKLIAQLNANKKDLAIKTNTATIKIPFGMVSDNETISLKNETLDIEKDKNVKMLESGLVALSGYKLDLKVGDTQPKTFAKPVQVELKVPQTVKDQDKVVMYQLKDGKWGYLESTLKNGKIVANIKSSGEIVVVESTKTFNDIKRHWAKRDIEILAAKQIVVGTGNDKFEPQTKLARVDFGSVLTRIFGSEKGIDFKERKEPLTRGQMAVMVEQALKENGMKQTVTTSTEVSKFKDLKNTSMEEKQALEYLVSTGLLKGTSKTTLSPNATLTRGEMSAIIIRLLDFMK
ncbi:MAG: DUF6359 domain-containing protein [Cellulosilyticaceae bacterium]